ncbi:MAG TPA: EndoU domain-containing protein [Candidatus Saccharimonadales bacterium]|nr:EndoU domain-containing protein [Candidatus Saccharimonadales bacterium]
MLLETSSHAEHKEPFNPDKIVSVGEVVLEESVEASKNLLGELDPLKATAEARMQDRRQSLVNDLIQQGLIDESFKSRLEAFNITASRDRKKCVDSLEHILLGDRHGGCHHLRTILALDESRGARPPTFYRGVGSPVGGNKAKKLRKKQTVQPNGAYWAFHIDINGREKKRGSAMFPDNWSTKKVLNSILEVSKAEPTNDVLNESVWKHQAAVDGVLVIVKTRKANGKIIAAFPDPFWRPK